MPRSWPGGLDLLAFHADLARVRREQARDCRNQRGLAAAGETDDRDELARFDRQVHVVQHFGAAAPAVGLAESFDFQDGHVSCSFSGARRT